MIHPTADVSPQAQIGEGTRVWHQAQVREGARIGSECVLGKVHTSQYRPGGYFYRPADIVNGGPASGSDTDVVWFLRETTQGTEIVAPGCVPTS